MCSSCNRSRGSLYLGPFTPVHGEAERCLWRPRCISADFGCCRRCDCCCASQSEEPYTNELRATLSAGMEPPVQSGGLKPPGMASFADDSELSAGDSAYRQHACAMLTVRLDLLVFLLLRKHYSHLAPPCARHTESMATSCSLREQRRGFGFGTCAILNPRKSLPISTARVCE